tara:strand:- start:254 stop:1189 length:936 start_codon:yes stop_codon:yes gene_type:complete
LKIRSPLSVASLLISLFATASLSKASETRPHAVAVDGILCDLVRTISSSNVKVSCLVPPTGDPHFYKLKPSDKINLSSANVIFHNGYQLTPLVNKLPSEIKTIAVGEVALNIKEDPQDNFIDPHVWHDPNNISLMATTIEANLKDYIPVYQWTELNNRTNKVKSTLSTLSSWITTQIDTIPVSNRVITSEHRAFSHLAKKFNMQEMPIIDSFSTKGKMRPSDLKRITSDLSKLGTRELLPETFPASKTLKRVSRASGIPISKTQLFLDGLAPEMSTVETAISNVCAISISQGGTCDQISAEKISSQWKNIP